MPRNKRKSIPFHSTSRWDEYDPDLGRRLGVVWCASLLDLSDPIETHEDALRVRESAFQLMWMLYGRPRGMTLDQIQAQWRTWYDRNDVVAWGPQYMARWAQDNVHWRAKATHPDG